MVPYSLPFSSAFFSKIIVSSVAVIVITTVSLNSYGSVTIGASNGTVLIIPKNNDSPPGLIDEKGSIFLEDKLDQVKKKNSSNLEVNAKKHKHDNILRNKKEIHKREIISEKIAFDQSIDEPRNFHSDIVPTIAPTIQKHESEPVNNSDNNGEDCSTIDMFLNPTDDHLDQVEVTSQVLTTKRSSVTLSTVKPHSIEQFPSDFIPENVRNNGGIIIHVLILAYCCLSLGVVCDIYFLPALEFISTALKIPSDIAGATFMAIGTSSPELFTSVIGVFVSEDDIGIGTILGTAVFNLIVIPAACGFAVKAFCPETPKINSFPILRDCIFYIITIMVLILCIMDGYINWVESTIMISLFLIYLIIMYFNAQYSNLIDEIDNRSNEEEEPLLKSNEINNSKRKRLESTRSERAIESIDDDDDENWIEGNAFIKYLLLPMTILFKITLPKPTKFLFIITFGMSVVWIGLLTYICVWMVTIIGYTFGLPETVAGLTILAAGTSVPELISSVIVVKRSGLANMAISNSIGSNIFDILFCLGIPWLLKSIILMFKTGSISFENTSIPILSEALPFTSLTLLITILSLVGTFMMTKWELGLTVGITCSIIYVAFLIIASIFEIQMG